MRKRFFNRFRSFFKTIGINWKKKCFTPISLNIVHFIKLSCYLCFYFSWLEGVMQGSQKTVILVPLQGLVQSILFLQKVFRWKMLKIYCSTEFRRLYFQCATMHPRSHILTERCDKFTLKSIAINYIYKIKSKLFSELTISYHIFSTDFNKYYVV